MAKARINPYGPFQSTLPAAALIVTAAVWAAVPTVGLLVAAAMLLRAWPPPEMFDPGTDQHRRAQATTIAAATFVRPSVRTGRTGLAAAEQPGWWPAAAALPATVVAAAGWWAACAWWPTRWPWLDGLLAAVTVTQTRRAWQAAAHPADGDAMPTVTVTDVTVADLPAAAAAAGTAGAAATAAATAAGAPMWAVAAVTVWAASLAGTATCAAVVSHRAWAAVRAQLAESEAWQLRWMQVPKAPEPPHLVAVHDLPEGDPDPQLKVASFTPAAGFRIGDYWKVAGGLQAVVAGEQPGAADRLLISAAPAVDSTGAASGVDPTLMLVTWPARPVTSDPLHTSSNCPHTIKFVLHHALDAAFHAAKLASEPHHLLRVRRLSRPDTSPPLHETVWQLTGGTTFAKLAAAAETVREQVGVPWLRVGRHTADSAGRPVPEQAVSVVLGGYPAAVKLRDPMRTARWCAALDLQASMVALGLGSSVLVAAEPLTRPGAEPLTEFQFVLDASTAWADLIRKAPAVAEHAGFEWLRVTRRADEDGTPDPTVSVLAGADPARTDLIGPSERLLCEQAQWDHRMRACKLVGHGGSVATLLDQQPVTDLIVASTFRAAEGVPPDAVRKALPALRATSGLAYLQVEPDAGGHAGRYQLVHATVDPLPQLAAVPDDIGEGDWNWLPAGVTAAGQVVGWDLLAAPHGLVTGQTGSGKSVLLQALLTAALLRGLQVTVVDPVKEGADFRFASDWCASFVTELHEAADTVEELYAEVRARKKVNAEHGVGSWRELPDGVRPTPALLIIDEAFSLLAKAAGKTDAAKADNDAKDRLLDTVGRIAREARAAGVHMVLAAQRPDAKVLAGELKANLGLRVLVGSGSEIERQMIFRSPELAPEVDKGLKGRAVLELEGADPVVMQGFFSPPDALAARLVELPVRNGGAAPDSPSGPSGFVAAPVPDGLWADDDGGDGGVGQLLADWTSGRTVTG